MVFVCGVPQNYQNGDTPKLSKDVFAKLTCYKYVSHKAVAEVSKIAHYRRLVSVNHGSQSKSTGSKSAWRQRSVVVVVIVIVVAT